MGITTDFEIITRIKPSGRNKTTKLSMWFIPKLPSEL